MNAKDCALKESERNVSERPLETLCQINKMVTYCLSGTFGVDKPNLAMNIWLELWTRNRPLTQLMVRNRCIDVVRKRHRRKELLYNTAQLDRRIAPSADVAIPRYRNEILNDIMTCPFLSTRDRRMLYLSFYLGYSGRQIGSIFDRSKVWANLEMRRILETLRDWIEKTGTKYTEGDEEDD